MPEYSYVLGPRKALKQLFPPAKYADPSMNFKGLEDVICHYIKNSLQADQIPGVDQVEVTLKKKEYHVLLKGKKASAEALEAFGKRHALIFSKKAARKAIRGKKLLKELGVWNPMEGYRVNRNPADKTSKWHLFPPLGLNVIGQKGVLLMHYPPWAIIQKGTFENAMTMKRWGQVLLAAGIPEEDVGRYKTIVDVNPIAAPGSGESEYPNDYFPIMMASGFFHGPKERDYIRSMLELYLSPPGHDKNSKYTLPLLICGSPLYDPQAPGWFRTTYTEVLPLDEDGIPQVNVLQAGKFRIRPDSPQQTPYMICNHMIAAGVTGRCTDDPSKIPDIRQYEAQDLVAATFLKLYADNPEIDPEEARTTAYNKWYGKENFTGVPKPDKEEDQRIICALAQMDTHFVHDPAPGSAFTFKQAMERCRDAEEKDNPCSPDIKDPGR